MHTFAIAAAMASIATALAIPQDTNQLVPPSTVVWYYNIGGWQTDTSVCLDQVANSTLQAGVCTCLGYAGMGIFQAPSNDCSLTMYIGTSRCDGAATSKTARHDPNLSGNPLLTLLQQVTSVPSGKSFVCVNTPVNAGMEASGVWACS